jgi:hypothetical protein
MRADEVRDVFERVDAEPSDPFSQILLNRLRTDYLRFDLDASGTVGDPPLDPVLIDQPYVDDEDLLEVDLGDVDRSTGRRPRGRLLVAACLAVALVATIGVVAVLRDGEDPSTRGGVTSDGRTPEPSAPEPSAPDAEVRRFALPPVRSVPSAPEHGEAVFALQACGGPSRIGGWSGRLTLWEDGRLIRHTSGEPVDDPQGWGLGPPALTGWLEQRLTPEGVELMRSAVASSGLPLESSPDQWCSSRDVYEGTLGEGTRTRFFDGVLPPDLLERLSHPASWLPPSAWEDRRARPFVPAGYLVAFSGHDPMGQWPDLASITAALPPEVRPLIRAMDWGQNHAGPTMWVWQAARAITLESAHALVDAIEAGGLEQLGWSSVPGPVYGFDHPAGDESDFAGDDEIRLGISPLLPGGWIY